jgi:RNA polymerase sigma-70 factor (ECF subfamily)
MAESYAIEDIFNQYKNKIYRLALSISKNEKDAEDIVQNTFVKITKNLSGFRGESSISTWIYKITFNEALMLLRKRHSQTRLTGYLEHNAKNIPSGLFVNWPRLPDEQLLAKEEKNRIETAIKQMPIKYRMALSLHHMEDMPVKDTAEVLGLKLNSLKTRLHRSYLLIRKEMEDYFKDHVQKQQPLGKQCSVMMSFIYDYAQGALDAKTRGDFDRHIQDCLPCHQFLDSYLRAIRISHALECQDLPAELQEKIKTFLKI